MDVDTNHQLLLVWSVNTIKASTHTHYTVHVYIVYPQSLYIYIYTNRCISHTYMYCIHTHTFNSESTWGGTALAECYACIFSQLDTHRHLCYNHNATGPSEA